MRVGWGFDAHRFGGEPPVLLAGVIVERGRGLVGTSDADVVAHAVADALLGAAALGDLGSHFPSGDPQWSGADSMELLAAVVEMITSSGLRPESLDVTVIAERVRVGPHREAIREALSGVLGLQADAVSVKATTTDGMGFLGRDEGIAAVAAVVASARR
jgi:2-C-methyl-D-erythritol 2,4-cyclodiphosphate synthase